MLYVSTQKQLNCKKRCGNARMKLWNTCRWRPRNGCDGRSVAKVLIMNIQVNLCILTRNQHRIHLNCRYENFCPWPTAISWLPPVFHNFFTLAFLHRAAPSAVFEWISQLFGKLTWAVGEDFRKKYLSIEVYTAIIVLHSMFFEISGKTNTFFWTSIKKIKEFLEHLDIGLWIYQVLLLSDIIEF